MRVFADTMVSVNIRMLTILIFGRSRFLIQVIAFQTLYRRAEVVIYRPFRLWELDRSPLEGLFFLWALLPAA